MPANQITALLDPTQLPVRTMDQTTFDAAWAYLMVNLPAFGAQINTAVANFNVAAAGMAYAIPYTIDLSGTTDVDPGNGKLRFDNATQNLAAMLRLDLLGSNGSDFTAMLDTFDASSSVVKGTIRVVKQADATKFLIYSVTARATPAGYRNISVTPVASTSANPFVNGDAVLLFFQRTGDKGDVGPMQVYPMLHVRDEKANGTPAGSGVAGVAVTRTLNTVKKNTISGAALASNQVTLPAGTYRLRGMAPAMADRHQAQLYNITGAAVLLVGTSELASSTGGYAATHSWLQGEIVLAASTVLELRHYTQTATNLGMAAGSGQVEVYSEIIFEKVA